MPGLGLTTLLVEQTGYTGSVKNIESVKNVVTPSPLTVNC